MIELDLGGSDTCWTFPRDFMIRHSGKRVMSLANIRYINLSLLGCFRGGDCEVRLMFTASKHNGHAGENESAHNVKHSTGRSIQCFTMSLQVMFTQEALSENKSSLCLVTSAYPKSH